MIASILAAAAQVIAGSTVRWLGCAPTAGQRVYIANHSSHFDFIVLWSYLPPPLRRLTRPVAARDYWERDAVRRYLATRVFNALLIDRVATPGTAAAGLGRQAVDQMVQSLDNRHSLILFPEGTRGAGEDLAPFRSGLYHLCRTRPEIEVIPVYLENLNRILPKGHLLPVPMLSRITFGAPLHLQPAEEKDAFLERARQAVRALKEAA
ncbi:MAG: 1-acyl-sn-glycerol-3-phosphate acyltransferase [Chloroflexi bacterium]|nr:MAG: 1-acyl-sn-glycerol-3-phosphate acyltransferase [Chloroflexota bacterium]